MRKQKTTRDPKRILWIALWQVLGALALLALVELGVRWVAGVPGGLLVPAPERMMVFDRDLGWRPQPNFDGEAFGALRRIDADGYQVVDTPQVGAGKVRPRLAIYGDSRTFGNGVRPSETYAEQLDRLLPGVDVINLGVPGYSSYQGLRLLEKTFPHLRPEWVVFAFGFNDRRSMPAPELADGPGSFRRLFIERRFLRRLRTVELLSRGNKRPQREVRVTELVPRVSAEELGQMYRQAARFVESRGARFVALQMRDAPQQAGELDRGIALFHAGRFREAERALREAVALDNAFSDAARWALVPVLEAQGKSAAARTVAQVPDLVVSSFGGRPLMPQAAYLENMNVPNGEVIDAGPALLDNREVFYDFCHFDARGHALVADGLFRSLRREALK